MIGGDADVVASVQDVLDTLGDGAVLLWRVGHGGDDKAGQ